MSEGDKGLGEIGRVSQATSRLQELHHKRQGQQEPTRPEKAPRQPPVEELPGIEKEGEKMVVRGYGAKEAVQDTQPFHESGADQKEDRFPPTEFPPDPEMEELAKTTPDHEYHPQGIVDKIISRATGQRGSLRYKKSLKS